MLPCVVQAISMGGPAPGCPHLLFRRTGDRDRARGREPTDDAPLVDGVEAGLPCCVGTMSSRPVKRAGGSLPTGGFPSRSNLAPDPPSSRIHKSTLSSSPRRRTLPSRASDTGATVPRPRPTKSNVKDGDVRVFFPPEGSGLVLHQRHANTCCVLAPARQSAACEPPWPPASAPLAARPSRDHGANRGAARRTTGKSPGIAIVATVLQDQRSSTTVSEPPIARTA
mmetsp:Transcript_49395/g.141316  ORF Transcript_49395/g.141316 Transcript_49395/m.141316 type:complete len:225 (-) Transcript_49395:466-1140(-)